MFHRKIKDNSYEWPAGIDLSAEAVDLVSAILTTQPEHRPSLTDVLAHDWFVSGPFPPSISTSSLTAPPDYRQMSIRASHRNFAAVKKQCGVTEAPATTLLPVVEKATLAVVAEEAEQAATTGMSRMALDGPAVVTEVRGMEKEVRDVLQPGSPISELLRLVPSPLHQALMLTAVLYRSARKPLMVSPNAEPRELLQRKLLAEARAGVSAPLLTSNATTSAPAPARRSQASTVSSSQKENGRSSAKENVGPSTKENDGRHRRVMSTSSVATLSPFRMGKTVAEKPVVLAPLDPSSSESPKPPSLPQY